MNKKLNWEITKSINQKKEKEIKDIKKKEEIKIKRESLMKLMEDFLLQKDIQENSKKTYFKGLKNFILWTMLEEKDNNEIALSKNLLIMYKNKLMLSKIKPHTQAVYLVSLKQFFVWTEANLIFPNIAKNIKGIKKITKQHHKDPLTEEDIIKLLHIYKDKKNIIAVRNYALLHILIFTGMRIGETIHIQLEDIEATNNEKSIIWIKGKGRSGKDSFVIALNESIIAIQNYLKMRMELKEELTPESYLFIAHGSRKKINQKINTDSISRIINQTMKKAGIKTKRISAHSLRHTYGVLAIKAGVSLHELQISMRHSTPATTQIYLGDIEKQKRKEGNTEKLIFDFLKNSKENKEK